MQKARMLGNHIQQLSEKNGLSIAELSHLLNCKDHQVKALLKGRAFATFDQLSMLAEKLGVTVTALLQGDEEYYNDTVVHCMNRFGDIAKREFILDIIDDYMDVFDAVNQ